MLINPTFYDVSQNSDEWYELRCGKFTASMFADLMAGKTTKTYTDVINKVAFERVTGKMQSQFNSKWMDYGHETEPEASENYELETFNSLENGGIWLINEYVGASPDAKIVGKNAGTEFKCPAVSTYFEYILGLEKKGVVELPKNYFLQVQGQLLCTGWEYIDYMPYYSSNVKQLLTRVYRCEETIQKIVTELEIAIEEVEKTIIKIKR